MKTSLGALVLILVGLIAGCTLFVPQETLYLQSAQHRATQEEIRQRLGQPKLVAATYAGETIWVYEVRAIEPGSQSTWSSMGSWCDEYVLTFDAGGVLRRWTHTSYLHGGEMMPDRCDSGVRKPAL
jgi:hypothetical protein